MLRQNMEGLDDYKGPSVMMDRVGLLKAMNGVSIFQPKKILKCTLHESVQCLFYIKQKPSVSASTNLDFLFSNVVKVTDLQVAAERGKSPLDFSEVIADKCASDCLKWPLSWGKSIQCGKLIDSRL